MISEKVYEIGAMLGLECKDINDILSSRSTFYKTDETCTPANIYKDVIYYGTVSIKDFK